MDREIIAVKYGNNANMSNIKNRNQRRKEFKKNMNAIGRRIKRTRKIQSLFQHINTDDKDNSSK